MQLSRKDPLIKLLYVTPEKVNIFGVLCLYRVRVCHYLYMLKTQIKNNFLLAASGQDNDLKKEWMIGKIQLDRLLNNMLSISTTTFTLHITCVK